MLCFFQQQFSKITVMKGREYKPHIGIFGRRNNGKSSIINVLAGHDVAIVSPVAGTTTDPVRKSMEIPGIGPAILIDTAGIDDAGDLGNKRILKSLEAIKVIDLAILVVTENTIEIEEEKLIESFKEFSIPFLIIHNKSDIVSATDSFISQTAQKYSAKVIDFSAINSEGNERLLAELSSIMPESAYTSKALVGDLFKPGEAVLLITPIDNEAPEGRMILPQVQAIRDILDNDGLVMICKENDVEDFIKKANPRPVLAVTDSQVFGKIKDFIPTDIPFTSFSILLARQRGDFYNYIKGTPHIDNLKNGDKVLILESCTHHVTCDDIGRHKIPNWLRKYTGKELEFVTVAGLGSVPGKINDYAMLIQCGGCVITKKQVVNRVKPAVDAGIPITNYGMAIAFMNGIFERAVNFIK